LGTITKGKRDMNTALALKIEKALGLEEGYFMALQVYYDIEQEKQKQNTEYPDLAKLRPVLFWDTKIEGVNWQKQKNAAVKRVFERGNDIEKEEITRFYGIETIDKIVSWRHRIELIQRTPFPSTTILPLVVKYPVAGLTLLPFYRISSIPYRIALRRASAFRDVAYLNTPDDRRHL